MIYRIVPGHREAVKHPQCVRRFQTFVCFIGLIFPHVNLFCLQNWQSGVAGRVGGRNELAFEAGT